MSIDVIKSVRAKTGLPLKDIQKAIAALNTTDENAIITYLREQGVLKQQSRQDRETNQGGIFSYVHEGRLGVLVEIRCETDFVSRSDSFQELGKDLALHIAAYQPKFLSGEEVDEHFVQNELSIAKQQLINEGKPEDKIEMILQGKRKKILEESSLLTQPFIKNPDVTVAQHVIHTAQATGEKVEVSRFTIFNLNA